MYHIYVILKKEIVIRKRTVRKIGGNSIRNISNEFRRRLSDSVRGITTTEYCCSIISTLITSSFSYLISFLRICKCHLAELSDRNSANDLFSLLLYFLIVHKLLLHFKKIFFIVYSVSVVCFFIFYRNFISACRYQ